MTVRRLLRREDLIRGRGQSRAAGLGAGTPQWSGGAQFLRSPAAQELNYRVRSREVQRRWLMFEIELTEGWTDTKRSPKRPQIFRGLSDQRVLASILLFPVWWVHGRFMYVNQCRHARQRPKQPSKTKSLKENITLLLRPPAFIPSYIVTVTF